MRPFQMRTCVMRVFCFKIRIILWDNELSLGLKEERRGNGHNWNNRSFWDAVFQYSDGDPFGETETLGRHQFVLDGRCLVVHDFDGPQSIFFR